MKRYVKGQLKLLLAQEELKLIDLANLLSKQTGKNCSANSLTQKLRRSSMKYDEMVDIADMLGYDVAFIKRDN